MAAGRVLIVHIVGSGGPECDRRVHEEWSSVDVAALQTMEAGVRCGVKVYRVVALTAVLTLAVGCRDTPPRAERETTRPSAGHEAEVPITQPSETGTAALASPPTTERSRAAKQQPLSATKSAVTRAANAPRRFNKNDLAFDSAWPPLPGSHQSVASASTEVKEAYAYVANRPDVMKHVPCYCGCERQGHDSAEDCFVKRRTTDGGIAEWDPMGFT